VSSGTLYHNVTTISCARKSSALVLGPYKSSEWLCHWTQRNAVPAPIEIKRLHTSYFTQKTLGGPQPPVGSQVLSPLIFHLNHREFLVYSPHNIYHVEAQKRRYPHSHRATRTGRFWVQQGAHFPNLVGPLMNVRTHKIFVLLKQQSLKYISILKQENIFDPTGSKIMYQPGLRI